MAKPTLKELELYADLRGQFKRIEDYTDAELDAVINVVGSEDANNYKILNFIDCYLERRRRKPARPKPGTPG